jgi:RHS repeat-associated protein
MNLNWKSSIASLTVFSMLAAFIPAQANAATPANMASNSSPTAKKRHAIIAEVVDKREANVKHFLLDDMTYEADSYALPVHYQINGKWANIDNSLIETTDSESKSPVYVNKANDLQVKFAKTTQANQLVKLKKEHYQLSWNLVGAALSDAVIQSKDTTNTSSLTGDAAFTNLPNLSTSVTYKDVFSNVDLNYQLIANQLKENLVFQSVPSTDSYSFELNTNQLVAKRVKNEIGFYAKKDSDVPVFTTSAPTLVDAAGTTSDAVSFSLEETKNGYLLTLTPDQTWLTDANRKYPVTLDPTITDNNGLSRTDTFISSNNPYSSYASSTSLKVGYSSSQGLFRSFLGFNLPDLKSSDVITRATLNMKLAADQNTETQVNLYTVPTAWTSSSLVWNYQPALNTSVIDYAMVKGLASDNKTFNWDFTEVAQQWQVEQANNGLTLRTDNESSGYTVFGSFNNIGTTNAIEPMMTFDYTNANGIEDFYTYHSLDVGRAGTANVQDFSGNLVFSHSDLQMTGERMPLSVAHTYNAADRQSVNLGYGLGWRLNLSQKITYFGNGYYSYTDEDGTEHYMKVISGSTYKDESGLELTMTIDTTATDSRFNIVDKSGNSLTFNVAGNLTSIKDNNSNTIALAYNAAGKLATATDGANRVTTFTWDTTNTYLTQMKDQSNRITSYAYTNGNLTKITYPDGKFVSYSYDASDLMTDAINIDGYKATFVYYQNANYRIKSMQEVGNNNGSAVNGKKLVFTYGKYRTSITDDKDNAIYPNAIDTKEVYLFNNLGNTVCVRDSSGKASYFKYGQGNAGVNKISASSKLQSSIMNKLMNHNVEATGGWTSGSDSGSTGSTAVDTANAYEGYKSLRIAKTGATGTHSYSQQVTLETNATYVFSAYIKRSSISGTGGAYLSVTYPWGATTDVKMSDPVKGTANWERSEVSFSLPQSSNLTTTVTVKVVLGNATGTAYFDALQLEKGQIPSRYNLVENPDFTNDLSFWNQNIGTSTGSGLDITTSKADPLDNNLYKMYGKTNEQREIYQDILVEGQAGESFTVGAWAKGNSVTTDKSPRLFALSVQVTYKPFYTGGSVYTETVDLPFNEDSVEWQYLADVITTKYAYSKIRILAKYYANENSMQFDGFQLYKEPFEDTYTYDSNHNPTGTTNLNQETNAAEYNLTTNDLTKTTDANGNVTTFASDSNHNSTKVTTPTQVETTNTIGNYGNVSNSKTKSSNVADSPLEIRTSSTYDLSGNYLTSTTDSSGHTVTYNYNPTKGTLSSVTDPNGKTTNYSYDANTDQMTSVSKSVGGLTVQNNYQYTDDTLTGITQNDSLFGFEYDAFDSNTKVKIGTSTILTNTFDPNSQQLTSTQYNAGNKIYYDYDPTTDALVSKTLVSAAANSPSMTPNFNYVYDNEGNLGTLIDRDNNVTYRYLYDVVNRLTKIKDTAGNSILYGYDPNGNVNANTLQTASGTYATTYTFDEVNQEKQVDYGAFYLDKNYDFLDRLNTMKYTLANGASYTSTLTYKNGPVAGTTTGLVDTYKNGSNSPYSYDYDSLGNIKTITQNGNAINYAYDELSQLIREDDKVNSQTIVYTYNKGGNMTSKKIYGYVEPAATPTDSNLTKVLTFTYGDTNWKDKLTAIKTDNYSAGVIASTSTQNISYGGNLIGNIASYGGNSLTWTWGTQLKTFNNSSNNITYSYNEAGIRTKKVVVNNTTGVTTTTNYVLDGNQVVLETDGTNTLHYTYSTTGQLVSININGTEYGYLFNAQGDVVGLIDGTGTQVVAYTYDAYGNILSTTGTLKDTVGKLNPYRYRSYRFDSETNLYYLQARYYNPDWGRFVSSDTVVGQEGLLNSHNMFIYCMNNPVMLTDPSGNFAIRSDVLAHLINIAILLVPELSVISKGVKSTSKIVEKLLGNKKTIKLLEKTIYKVCKRLGIKSKNKINGLSRLLRMINVVADISIGGIVSYVLGEIFGTTDGVAKKYVYFGKKEYVTYINF